MASLLPGFEYDIFISYRQKDNKYDGWVTEFVEHLKDELESTFKEEISVYFDINPHDGLLETDDVDASLKEKLKCLVFIPIISRTYCDPKSFAWEHEFKAFVEQASIDELGLKVKLANGNVACRVLPVKVHDLDSEDIKECESVLGGVLRGVDFIYEEPGVNRPLKEEDDEKKNLNNTRYRNQINKVANAIGEIIRGLKNANALTSEENIAPKGITTRPSKEREGSERITAKIYWQKSMKRFLLALIVLLCIIGVYAAYKIIENSKTNHLEKSIAVLPFINDGSNDSTTYFMDGVMDEILANLQKIKDLRVISRTSVEQYRKKTKSIPEIAKELGVNYILEGSGQKSGNTFHLRVQLIKVAKEGHLWANTYDQENSEARYYFSIQSQIAQTIAAQLEAVITPREKQLIEKTHTTKLEAYDAYLKGEFFRKKETKVNLDSAMKYYKIALKKDPDYTQAYCGMAKIWFYLSTLGALSPSEGVPEEYAALMTAQKLDSSLAEVHLGLAFYKTNTKWDWKGGEAEYKKTISINPNYAEAHASYSEFLMEVGRSEEAMKQIELALKLDPYDPTVKSIYGFNLLYVHRYQDVLALSGSGPFSLIFALHLTGKYDKALELWKTSYQGNYPGYIHAFDKGYAKSGYYGALKLEADTLFSQSKTSYINPVDIAILYVCSGNKERALDNLERGYEVHDQNLALLLLPIFDCLHKEPRYKALCSKMNLPFKRN